MALFSNLTTGRFALCVFHENEIYEAFLKSRRHRFGCPKHGLSLEDAVFEGDLNFFSDCFISPFNKSNEVFLFTFYFLRSSLTETTIVFYLIQSFI